MKVNLDPQMTATCDLHPNEEQPPNIIQSDDIDFTDVREQRGVILSILNDFLEDDTVGLLGRWIKHVGFDLRSIRYPADLPAAWLAHYRKGRGYDYERALNDFVTWPPIARLIDMPAENKVMPSAKKNTRQQLLIDLGKLANDL